MPETIGTILAGLVLTAGITGIILKGIKNKRQGKTSCGCGCSACAMNGACHSDTKK